MTKKIVLDCEVYKNYFLASFMDIESGKIVSIEKFNEGALDQARLDSIMRQYLTISFNGLNYDLLIISAALKGASNKTLKEISDYIIKQNKTYWQTCQKFDLMVPKTWNHIDLIEVAPGQSSLKIYGGRLHSKKLQDLPIEPDAIITEEQRKQLLGYCENDLILTKELYGALEKQIDLRVKMGEQYGLDLRSKSDAQIAEEVIKSELHKVTGETYRAPQLPDNYNFKYRNPSIISFKTKQLQSTFERILSEGFGLGSNGSVVMPEWLRTQQIEIAGAKYQMGIGGLHSCEKSQFVKAGNGYVIEDRDVASYYPNIILQQNLAPESLGMDFIRVYQSIVERRLKAKREGDKVTADTLKICVNGSFGKLGSKYSFLYSPDLLIQTTITGQLALLMLIEALTLKDIKVLSANTDGIVLYYHESKRDVVEDICFDWMLTTTYELETTPYKAIASRDVNNYVAVTTDGRVKGKGVFAKPSLSKNPDFSIITRSVAVQIAEGTPYQTTIRKSRDITEFVSIRRVTGGAIWRGEELGRSVRFYQSSEVLEDESILYSKNSNRVPKSAGARPLMNLPDTFPDDIDYKYYETEAEKLLCEVGYL